MDPRSTQSNGVIDGTLIRAARKGRGDVAAFLKNPRLQSSGFSLKIGGEGHTLRPGIRKMYLVGLVNDEQKLYMIRSSLYLDGR